MDYLNQEKYLNKHFYNKKYKLEFNLFFNKLVECNQIDHKLIGMQLFYFILQKLYLFIIVINCQR